MVHKRKMSWEFAILDFIQTLRTPIGDFIWPAITVLGNGGIFWILLTIALLINKKTRKSGWILMAALLVDLILCNGVIKNAVARTRPYIINSSIQLLIDQPKEFSFPSGHTAVSFTAVTALFLAKEKILWKIALVLAVLIAFSRLYLYVHFPTDILGGVIVGMIAGVIGFYLVEFIYKKKLG